MWYSSFWSEGPKNHQNLNILVSKFVPLWPQGVPHHTTPHYPKYGVNIKPGFKLLCAYTSFPPKASGPVFEIPANLPHWIRSRFKTWKWRDIWDKPLCRLPPWWTTPTNSPPVTFLPNPKDRNLLFFKQKLSGEMFQKHSYLRTLCSLALHICKLYLGNNGQNHHFVFRQWFNNHTRIKD